MFKNVRQMDVKVSNYSKKNLFAISTTITGTKEISSAALKAFAAQDY